MTILTIQFFVINIVIMINPRMHLIEAVSYTHLPLKQFILKSKIDEANYLLTDTNLSIGEIAVKLGYTDAHNFARTYKKSTGLSPSAYREAYAKRLLFHV